MPHAPARPCRVRGCPGLTTARNGYCDDHKSRGWKQKTKGGKVLTASERGYGWQWQKLRDAVLAAEPLCRQCQEEGRTTLAQEVDHIIPKSQGGTDDWENLAPICKQCHRKKSAREGAIAANQKGYPRVIMVVGPPGAGKTHYVREHMAWGDLIFDYDAIQAALSFQDWYERPPGHHPYIEDIRKVIIKRLQRPGDLGRAWIINSMSDVEKIRKLAGQLNAQVIMVVPDAAVCIERVRQDDRRKGSDWEKIIHEWFDNYHLSRVHNEI